MDNTKVQDIALGLSWFFF